MSYSPHIYGAASAVTEKTLQLSTRPAAWEHYVASGNVSTQKLYGSEDALRAAYAAAAAAAGDRDIVTLTAQTDGSTAAGTTEQHLGLPVSPHVSDFSSTSLYARGIIFRGDVFTQEMLDDARLTIDVPSTAVAWAWYGATATISPETPLDYIQDATLTNGSVELPGDVPPRTYELLLLVPRVSPHPATYGELLAHTPQLLFGAYSATAAAAEDIGARLIGDVGVPVVRVTVVGAGIQLGGTQIATEKMQFPVRLTGEWQLSKIELGIPYSGGALLRTSEAAGVRIALTQGVASLDYPIPAGDSTLIITLDSSLVFPTTAAPAGADAPADGVALGSSPHLVRYAGAQPIRCTLTRELNYVPNYTGTITITSYVPEEDSALTPEGEPRPTTAVTMTTASSSEQRTINPQDDWSELRKMAWEAARSGQYQFQYFYEWRDVWAYLQEGDLVIPEEKTVSVDILSATYTWYSQSADATEPPPGVTPLYDHKGPGSAEPLTGYADQWYRHTLTYTNA